MRLIIGLFAPKNKITGTDFAGIIESVGEQVTSFKVGDKVFGFDDTGLCSHAQYIAVDENKATLMPGSSTFEQAAASIEGAHYAYNFINKVNLKAEHKILINGTTGAIGSAMLQLAKTYACEITAVCGTKNIDLVKSLGADKVIDYQKEDFTKEEQQYDFVFDAVGKSTFGKCKTLLKSGGIYISSELGPFYQNVFYVLMKPLLGRRKVLFPMPIDVNRSALLMKRLIEQGKFKPLIDRTYSLEKIVEAYRYVLKGEKTGNVIIKIPN